MFRSSSPALNDKTFGDYRAGVPVPGYANAMTIEGTATKTGVLLLFLLLAAGLTWSQSMAAMAPALAAAKDFLTAAQVADGVAPSIPLGQAFSLVPLWFYGGAIGGFVVALIIIFKNNWAPFLAPVYALLEGLFLGGLSAVFEAAYPGIAGTAAFLTIGTLGALLFAYRTGLIRATEKFKMGVFAATAGIGLVYLIGMVMSFFGSGIPLIHGNSWVGIGFSLFVVVIASLNLVLDFDLIEQGVKRGAPKYMEWYGGFALLVTLVWLYIEMLRLLAKLRSRD